MGARQKGPCLWGSSWSVFAVSIQCGRWVLASVGRSPVLQGCWSGGTGGHGRDAVCCLPHQHFVFTFLDPQNNHGSQTDRSTSCVLQLRRLRPSPGKGQAGPPICIHPPDQNYSLRQVPAVLYLIFSQGGFLTQGGICILACREVNIYMEGKKGKSFGLVKTQGLRAPLLPAGRASQDTVCGLGPVT